MAIIAAHAKPHSRRTASTNERVLVATAPTARKSPSSGARLNAALPRRASPLQLLHTLSHAAVENFVDATAQERAPSDGAGARAGGAQAAPAAAWSSRTASRRPPATARTIVASNAKQRGRGLLPRAPAVRPPSGPVAPPALLPRPRPGSWPGTRRPITRHLRLQRHRAPAHAAAARQHTHPTPACPSSGPPHRTSAARTTRIAAETERPAGSELGHAPR